MLPDHGDSRTLRQQATKPWLEPKHAEARALASPARSSLKPMAGEHGRKSSEITRLNRCFEMKSNVLFFLLYALGMLGVQKAMSHPTVWAGPKTGTQQRPARVVMVHASAGRAYNLYMPHRCYCKCCTIGSRTFTVMLNALRALIVIIESSLNHHYVKSGALLDPIFCPKGPREGAKDS